MGTDYYTVTRATNGFIVNWNELVTEGGVNGAACYPNTVQRQYICTTVEEVTAKLAELLAG